MLEEDNDETCWNNLENFRVKLISVIDPSRITPYLRQCKVISHDDEEQVLNDPSLVMRKRKAGGWSAAFGSVDAPVLCWLLGADWNRVLTDWAWRNALLLGYHLLVFRHESCRHCCAAPFLSLSPAHDCVETRNGNRSINAFPSCVRGMGAQRVCGLLVFWISRSA